MQVLLNSKGAISKETFLGYFYDFLAMFENYVLLYILFEKAARIKYKH